MQPLHELDPPRSYRTIVACGVLGLGSTRAQDEEALRRFHGALEPGGTLVLDHETPYANARRWPLWTTRGAGELPEPGRRPVQRDRAADGAEYELRARAVDLDPLDQTLAFEIRADKWMSGEHVAEETHALSMRMYFRDELLLLLERAGFSEIDVRGGYAGEDPDCRQRRARLHRAALTQARPRAVHACDSSTNGASGSVARHCSRSAACRSGSSFAT